MSALKLPVGPKAQSTLVDRHLAKADVAYQPALTVNYLDTQIAMVEAGQGIAIIPSYGLPAGRRRKLVMIRLINPVVPLEFSQSVAEAENFHP